MKVALVSDRFGRGGGLELWIGQVAAELARRGHDVHALAFHTDADADATPVRVHRLPWREGRLARAEEVARAAAALAPDIVHDTGVGWRGDVLQPQAGSKLANREGDLASLGTAARLLARLSPRAARWRGEVMELERRQYAAGAGLVVAVSRKVADDLVALWNVAESTLRIVPNGVDTARFAPERCAALRPAARAALGVVDATPVFLFIARNPRLKGLSPLLRAVADLHRRGVALRVVVLGSEVAPAFRREAARLGIGRAVHFGGPVDDPLPHYAAADAFVLPTWYDACSLTVLEACACGLPAITTRRNGAAELIAHGRDGYVLERPDDAVSLAALMVAAVEPAARMRVAPAARALALRHGICANVDALERVYDEVLAARVRARAVA